MKYTNFSRAKVNFYSNNKPQTSSAVVIQSRVGFVVTTVFYQQ